MQQPIDVAADVSGQPKGKLRVTASVSFRLKCIVPLLPNFSALYPNLTVDLFAARIDVAVRLGLLADSTLIAQQLMRTHYSVCASPDHLKRSGQLETPMDMFTHFCGLVTLASLNRIIIVCTFPALVRFLLFLYVFASF